METLLRVETRDPEGQRRYRRARMRAWEQRDPLTTYSENERFTIGLCAIFFVCVIDCLSSGLHQTILQQLDYQHHFSLLLFCNFSLVFFWFFHMLHLWSMSSAVISSSAQARITAATATSSKADIPLAQQHQIMATSASASTASQSWRGKGRKRPEDGVSVPGDDDDFYYLRRSQPAKKMLKTGPKPVAAEGESKPSDDLLIESDREEDANDDDILHRRRGRSIYNDATNTLQHRTSSTSLANLSSSSASSFPGLSPRWTSQHHASTASVLVSLPGQLTRFHYRASEEHVHDLYDDYDAVYQDSTTEEFLLLSASNRKTTSAFGVQEDRRKRDHPDREQVQAETSTPSSGAQELKQRVGPAAVRLKVNAGFMADRPTTPVLMSPAGSSAIGEAEGEAAERPTVFLLADEVVEAVEAAKRVEGAPPPLLPAVQAQQIIASSATTMLTGQREAVTGDKESEESESKKPKAAAAGPVHRVPASPDSGLEIISTMNTKGVGFDSIADEA
ncbi:unnamed protein product, partial [Amoebophrya sp. A120]|eukprot:GSA120T00023665001.1